MVDTTGKNQERAGLAEVRDHSQNLFLQHFVHQQIADREEEYLRDASAPIHIRSCRTRFTSPGSQPLGPLTRRTASIPTIDPKIEPCKDPYLHANGHRSTKNPFRRSLDWRPKRLPGASQDPPADPRESARRPNAPAARSKAKVGEFYRVGIEQGPASRRTA